MDKIEIIKELAKFFYENEKKSLEAKESNLKKFLKGEFIEPDIQFIFPLKHIEFICRNQFSFDNGIIKKIYEYNKNSESHIEYLWREINDNLQHCNSEIDYYIFNPNINNPCFNCFFKFQCNKEKEFRKYWEKNNNCNQCNENLLDIFFVYLLFTIRKKTNDKFKLFNIKFGKIVCCNCLEKLIKKNQEEHSIELD